MHESASRPSTRLMVRRITVVGSRLELSSRVTSERRDSRSRPASAARRASRSCSKTSARSRACAVTPASVERKRSSGSPGSGCAANARESTPSGPMLPISGSLTTVTGSARSSRTCSTISTSTSRRRRRATVASLWAARRARPRYDRARNTNQRGCRRRAPCRARAVRVPAARQAGQRPITGVGTRTTADSAPRARRASAMAACATSPGVVAAARAELSRCRCSVRSRLTNSVMVRRARSTACAPAPVMVKRNPRSGSEISRSSSQWTTTAPMVRSKTTRGITARARKRVEAQRREDVGSLAADVLQGFAEKRDVLAQHGSIWLQGRKHHVGRLAWVVAEPPQGQQLSAFVQQGEGCGVDVELVAQRGEHGVGHLCRVGRGGQGPGHRLHALRRLGGDAAPALVPRLGACRRQQHVALASQVGDPHRKRRGGKLGEDAQCVVQLAVAVCRRADDEREEGGKEADQRRPAMAARTVQR